MRDEVPQHVLKSAKDGSLKVTARIGTAGLTPAVVNEIREQLKRRRLVKVKLNRGLVSDSAGRSELWGELSAATTSRLVLTRGNVAVFWFG